MSQIRLYVDEDAEEHVAVRGLRRLGINVLTADEAGELRQPDERHLIRAIAEGRVIYTLNTNDFALLHHRYLSNGISHPGIVTIPGQRYSVGEKIRRIADFIDSTTAEEMIDRMEFL
jgi:hypothetical protein